MLEGRRNGFTLIELLVVIAIMSILTIITVSQYGSARKRSRDIARKADLNSLSKAILTYYADYGYFPQVVNIVWGGEFDDSTGYIYMKLVPQENYTSGGWDQYCYAIKGDDPLEPDKFALFSDLENDEDGEYFSDYSPAGCSPSYNFAIFSPNAAISDFSP